jgi:hypothetical protein
MFRRPCGDHVIVVAPAHNKARKPVLHTQVAIPTPLSTGVLPAATKIREC